MLSIIKKNLFLLNLGGAIGLFLLLYLCTYIQYETNDDIIMALFASGAYSGEPDGHLVFINVLYGFLISSLYRLFPSFEWYTIAFVVISIFSLAIITTQVIASKIRVELKIALVLFFYSMFVELIVQLQFTKTTAILAVAGISLILNTQNRLKYLGAVLFCFASLIRFEAAILVLAIAAPVFVALNYQQHKLKIGADLKIVALMVLVVVVCRFINNAYYNSNEAWASYMNYNLVRGKVNDNLNTALVKENLPQNISLSDYNAINKFFIDPSVISYEKLQGLHKNIEAKVSFTKKIKNLRQIKAYYIWITLFLIIGVASFFKGRKIINLLPLITLGTMLVLFVWVSLDGVLKERVFFVSALTFIALLVISLKDELLNNQNKLILFTLFLLVLYINRSNYKKITYTKDYYESVYAPQTAMIQNYLKDEKKKLIPFSYYYNIESIPPFQLSSSFYSGKMFFLGWLAQIPYNERKLDNFNVFVDGYGVFTQKESYMEVVSIIKESLLEHKKITVEPQIISESNGYVILEFKK